MLTGAAWIETTKRLRHSPAALHILYYLKTVDPYGQKEFDLSVRELGEILDYNPSTISRALKVLEAEKYISLDLVRIRVRIRPYQEFLSGEKTLRACNTCCIQATGVACTQQGITGEKLINLAQNYSGKDFEEICGKLNVVPITRSDLLERTIGTTYPPEGGQEGPLVHRQDSGGGTEPNLEPRTPSRKPLPQGRVMAPDPLLERLVMHGIKPNKTILGVIQALQRTHPPAEVEKIVENALSAMQEQGRIIHNPGGFFVAAVQRGFTANGEKRNSRVRRQAKGEAGIEPPSTPQAQVLRQVQQPKPPPDWTQFSLAIDQAMLHGNHTFALMRLQDAWADGWQDKVEELVMLRKRDWPFQITAQGVVYIGE